MTSLQQLLPLSRSTTPDVIVQDARRSLETPLDIGADVTRDLCAALSRNLLRDTRAAPYPDLAALGFWLRPASIERMMQDYLSVPPGVLRVPVGVTLHLPPSNVASLFVYGAVVSLLCGDCAIVRLSSKENAVQRLLVEILDETLQQSASALRDRLIIIRYGHDDEITAALSRDCDLRLVWGGDATVSHIHNLPLPPLSREVGFADRFSASALNAAAYLSASEKERENLISAFYNDMYWFDQFACASPRLLVWVGKEKEAAQAALDFYPRLAAQAEKQKYTLDVAAGVARTNSLYLALHDLPAAACQRFDETLIVVTLSSLQGTSAFKPVNFGYGLLLSVTLDALSDLAPFVERRDQTLTTWGFTSDQIKSFAQDCRGQGFDRIVPVGQALAFDPLWDGNNLFDVMTRFVRI